MYGAAVAISAGDAPKIVLREGYVCMYITSIYIFMNMYCIYMYYICIHICVYVYIYIWDIYIYISHTCIYLYMDISYIYIYAHMFL